MKKLMRCLKSALILWKMGFFLSNNTTDDKSGKWGFIRVNFDNGIDKSFALSDFDFQIDSEGNLVYVHFHNGNQTLFRFDARRIN